MSTTVDNRQSLIYYDEDMVEITINKNSLSQQLFSVILNRITSMELKPGARVNLEKLKHELGVSNAPIREALQRLAQERLVIVKPRIGFFIVKLTREEAADLYGVRRIFESYALRNLIEHIPAEPVERIRSYLISQHASQAADGFDKQGLDQVDVEIHKHLLISNCDNQYIRNFYESISNFISILRHSCARFASDIEEHLVLLEAILQRDIKRAEEALIVHLRNAEQATLAGFTRIG